MIEDLIRYFGTIENRGPDCRALVLYGTGENFCAGGDLKWMKSFKGLPAEENLAEAERFSELFRRLRGLPLPTIALVDGAALGGGSGLVASCDWAIASTRARFSLPEVRLGLSAAIILPSLLDKIRPGTLRRWVLTGKTITAEEALAGGLVERVVGVDELETALREDLDFILRGDVVAQANFKRRHAEMMAVAESGLAAQLADGRVSDRAQEGMGAFLKRELPSWVIDLPVDFRIRERP